MSAGGTGGDGSQGGPRAAADLLAHEAGSLVARLRLWTPARWAAAAPPCGTRADLVHHLAQWLADAAGEAPVRLPRLDSDLALPGLPDTKGLPAAADDSRRRVQRWLAAA